MNVSRFCLVGGVMLLAGCAGNTVAPSMYLLDMGSPAAQVSRVEAPVVVVDTVTVAPYLDESGIVVQTAPHRVVQATNNRWASPLTAQLTAGLREGLQHTVKNASIHAAGAHAGPKALHLITRVNQFMGHYDGQAHIAGRWRIVDAGGTQLAERRFEQRVALDDDGYDALVNSLSRGWQDTAHAMGEQLNTILADQ